MMTLWSPLVTNLDPYEAGEQPKDKRYIKLNTNENPYPPSPRVLDALRHADLDALRLYPDPDSKALVSAIADFFQVPEASVFVGNGSDEVLAFAFIAFFKQAAPLYFPEITYSFYPAYCQLFDIEYQTFPLDSDWQINFDSLEGKPGGIIFPNPNAPTGRLLALDTIEVVAKKYSDVVLIIDEAYIDFGGTSAALLTQRYPNVLVVQTLSKSRSLAGMRVGFALGDPELIEALQRVKNSFNAYPLDQLAIKAAVAAFEDRNYFDQCCKKVMDTRAWVTQEMQQLEFEVLPSFANFLFVRHPRLPATEIAQQLRDQGVLVRHFKKPAIEQFLRITIGLEADMKTMMEVLQGIVKA